MVISVNDRGLQDLGSEGRGTGLRRAVISVNDRGAEGTLQVGSSRQAQPGDRLLPRAGLTPPWPLGDLLPLLDSGPGAYDPGEGSPMHGSGLHAGQGALLPAWLEGWPVWGRGG